MDELSVITGGPLSKMRTNQNHPVLSAKDTHNTYGWAIDDNWVGFNLQTMHMASRLFTYNDY